jgi:hypothetical protein
MVVEIMAANAAFKLIKETLKNGGELFDAGKAIGDWMGASRKISKLPASKSANFGSAFEGFQAQEEIKRQRAELELMIKKTRIHAWRDFLEYEADYYREIREAEKLALRNKHRRDKALNETFTLLAKVFGILFLIMGALVGVAIYLRS